jgi:Ca2+-transporting ATPase
MRDPGRLDPDRRLTVQTAPSPQFTTDDTWYARSPSAVAEALGVDPAVGLTSQIAAERLRANGPNALPEERHKPGWQRFLEQYRSYMQIILLAAAIVSAVIAQWGTAVLLLLLTVLNAVIGLRQEGKAESAMNALKSMMKATARVRRDGDAAEIPAEQVVVGDVVLLAGGDQVPADGRIVEASALQIDESALTGESTPAAKDASTLEGRELGPGDQMNMAFMNTPVTHGSATMIATGTGAATQFGKISALLSATAKEKSPLTKELDRLTLWIAGAAGLTMIVMFVLGRSRGEAWDVLFVSAVALAIAAIPEALPTVTQMILSLGGIDLAKRNAIVKELPSVETLAFTSAINSDKTGTLTMNQMTAVEVVTPSDRYTISGTGYDLAGKIHHAAGTAPSVRRGDPAVRRGERRPAGGRPGRRRPHGGRPAGARAQGRSRHRRHPRRAAPARHAALRPVVQAHGRVHLRHRRGRPPGRPVLRQGRGAGRHGARRHGALRHRERCVGRRTQGPDERPHGAHGAGRAPGDGGGGARPGPGRVRSGRRPARVRHRRRADQPGRDGRPAPRRVEGRGGERAGRQHPRPDGDRRRRHDRRGHRPQLRIPGTAILGADFAALPEHVRIARIDEIGVVGRVAPEHKVLLVDTLKKKGDVVAMTGDGVNDAPAIKAADIGIAMGSGTDVAKNAGRMILSDDNFATIVFAVEQGRKIYDNLTKYIRFVLILLVVFVLTFLGASLLNIAAGEPFNPAQVLWIHFFVNAAFGFALGFDRETPGLMSLKPRPRGQSVLTTDLIVTVALTGLYMSACLLALIVLGTQRYGDLGIGQSIAFTSFALCLIVAALECRSATETVLTTSTFDSKQMNKALLIEAVLAVLVTQMDVFQRLLGTVEINLAQFGWALLSPLGLLVLWELGKLAARRTATPSGVRAEVVPA